MLSAGAVVQPPQRTGPDGRVDVRVAPGSTVTLQILVNGASVAEYIIGLNTAAFDPVTTLAGQQERLRHMGYQIGHTGAGGDGVDPVQVMEFERGLLDFQADAGLLPDANIDVAALNASAAANTAAGQAGAAAADTAAAQRAQATQNALTGPNGAGA